MLLVAGEEFFYAELESSFNVERVDFSRNDCP